MLNLDFAGSNLNSSPKNGHLRKDPRPGDQSLSRDPEDFPLNC